MALTLTPLRYPGGKTKLSPFVSRIFAENSLQGGHYVEPYAGGAGLAITLLMNGFARYLHLNDLDLSIYAVWHSILYETKKICQYINDVTVDMDEWRKQKEIQSNKNDTDLLDLGISTIFLNRTNRSGVLTGGVIGGNLQHGAYKIDARFNKKSLIEKIEKIASFKSKIKISNEDAKCFLRSHVSKLPSNTLVNLDPPYYIKGKYLYKNSYSHADHEEISKEIRDLSQYWIVTYDNVDQIRTMYAQYEPIEFNLSYSVNKYYRGKEILIADPRLKIPSLELLEIF